MSKQLIRTNPSLSTNVKITLSDDGMLLRSFDDINVLTSDFSYKDYTINPKSSFEYDLANFWNQNEFDSESLFDPKSIDNTYIRDTYDQQYPNIYESGVRHQRFKGYDYSYFAPLWVSDKMPEYFVIFRLDEPTNINNIHDLKSAKIIKTFSFNDNSVGDYFNGFIDRSNSFKQGIELNYDDNVIYRGISVENGGFVEAYESSERFTNNDLEIISFDELLTTGFKRNRVVSSNLLNIEFLFNDDVDASTFELSRYIGLYCDTDAINSFIVDGQMTINDNIVLLSEQSIIDDDSIQQYIKYNGELHTISYENYQIVLKTDLNIDFSKIYTEPQVDSKFLKLSSFASPYTKIEILDNIADNNYFTIGYNLPLYTIYATDTLQKNTFSTIYFSSNGTPNDIASAMSRCINNIPDNKLYSFVVDAEVYILYNDYFNNDNLYISTDPLKLDNSFDIKYTNFTDPLIDISNKFAIESKFGDFVQQNITNLFVSNTDGTFSRLIRTLEYVDAPIYDEFGNVIGYSNIQDYITIEFDGDVNNVLVVDGTVQLYFRETFESGVLIFYDIADFYFDTYRSEYTNDLWEQFYKTQYLTNHDTLYYNDVLQLISDNNIRYSPLRFESSGSDYYSMINDVVRVNNNEASRFNNQNVFIQCRNLLDNLITECKEHVYTLYNIYLDIRYIVSQFNVIRLNDIGITPLFELTSTNVYDLNNENFTINNALKSKLTPYINAWVSDGKDVKFNDYRIGLSNAFGTHSLSPSYFDKTINSRAYTHEWYYYQTVPRDEQGFLSKYVDNYSLDDICKQTYKYFTYNFNISSYINSTYDYFKRYFEVDYFTYTNGGVTSNYSCDKQIKYSELYDIRNQYSQCFFNGAKINFRTLSEFNEDINSLQSVSFIDDESLNGYTFSAIIKPTYYEYNVQLDGSGNVIEFDVISSTKDSIYSFDIYKNEVYRNILFVCSVRIPYVSNLNPIKPLLDAFSLYNMADLKHIDSGNDINLPYPLSGSIDLSNQIGFNTYRLIRSNDGSNPNLLSELVQSFDGTFGQDLYIVEKTLTGYTLRYRLNSVVNVLANDMVQVTSVDVFQPPIETSDEFYKRTILFAVDPNNNYFKQLFEKCSFANIVDNINNVTDKVSYYTINETGLTKGSNIVMLFEDKTKVNKTTNIVSTVDLDVPDSLVILNTNVGYVNSLNNNSNLLYRDNVFCNPKFDIISQFDYSTYDVKYKFKDFLPYRSFYNKIKTELLSNIINVNEPYEPLYPLVDEVAIQFDSRSLFSGILDDDTYIRSRDRFSTEKIHGSYSHVINTPLFNNMVIRIPNEIRLSEFTTSIFIYENGEFELQINWATELYNYFINIGLLDYISTYIDYNFTTLSQQDFEYQFFVDNILRHYELNFVELYNSPNDGNKDTFVINFNALQQINGNYTLANNQQIIEESNYILRILNKSGDFTSNPKSFGLYVYITKKEF